MLKDSPYLQPPNSGAAMNPVDSHYPSWFLSLAAGDSNDHFWGHGQGMGDFYKFPAYAMFCQSWEPL